MPKYFVLCAFLASTTVAVGQTNGFVNVGPVGSAQVYVASGSNAVRVGRGVLTYVHQKEGGFSTSMQVFATCDGTVLSNGVRFSYAQGTSLEEIERGAKAEAEAFPLYRPEFLEWARSELPFAKALKPHMQTLCKNPAPEPRNTAIPVGTYMEKGKERGGSVAVLTGTAATKGRIIEAWLRNTMFTSQPLVVGGEPILQNNGLPEMHRTTTGAYELRRNAFNCAARQLATYQVLAYNKDGVLVDQHTTPRERSTFRDVVPDSLGELQLDAVCKIYGNG